MCETSTDPRHVELSRWLLEAIGKVRRQKQRPSIERISAAVRQLHCDVSVGEVSSGLDHAVRSGTVICVENNGAISYRESASHLRRHSVASLSGSPSPGMVSEAVVLAVREIGSGCSQVGIPRVPA